MRTAMLAYCLLCSSCSLLAFDDLVFDREPVDGAGATHDGAVLEPDAALDDAGIVEPDAAFATPRARPVLVPRFPLSPCAGADPSRLRVWITAVTEIRLEVPGSCGFLGGPVIDVEQLTEATESVMIRPFDVETCAFYRQRSVSRVHNYLEEGIYTSATEGTARLEYHFSGSGGQSCDDYFDVTFRDEVGE